MENTFITYEKALAILEAHKADFPEVDKDITSCIGEYLAEDLKADRDFPPFDRVTMDGIAIAYSSFAQGQRKFNIESIAPAGSPQSTLNDTSNCIEVMTGAIMPRGVDTVIRYEDLSITNGEALVILDTLKAQQNVHFKGMDIAKDAVIVSKGKYLSPAEINIAAAIGKEKLRIKQLPKMILFSTGDELVDVHETPKQHQIRRSNVYGIQATLKEWGISVDLHHLADDKVSMLDEISKALKRYDVFIFTGGVSKGKFDFLPEVLEELKIEKHFHKIQQRPGKPFWFGTNTYGKKVFALPGNPVSSFVCVYMYLQFWLQKSLGAVSHMRYVKLKNDISFKPDLVYFLEAKLESLPDGTLVAEAIKGNGSGDFANLVKTDGFLILPQKKQRFFANDSYPFVPYRSNW